MVFSLSPIHKKIIEEKIILNNETPPALPPKRSSLNTNSSDRSSGEDQTRISSPVLSRSPIRECKIPITVDTTDSVSISPIRMESPALNEIIPPMVNVESVREPSPLSCDSKYTDGDDSEVVLRHGHGNADEKQVSHNKYLLYQNKLMLYVFFYCFRDKRYQIQVRQHMT